VTIIAVTGLKREARIAAGPGVKTISGGGRTFNLEGKLNAAIDKEVQGIISIGICGGLSAELLPGTCVIASEIVTGTERIRSDPAWMKRMCSRLPQAMVGPIASTAVLIQNRTEKSTLFRKTGAYAVEMESHVAAPIARLHGVPFAALRTIADPAESDLPPAAALALTEDGGVDLFNILASLLAHPGQIPALVRAGRQSSSAFDALFRCRDMLGFGLAGPDVGELAFDMR
jgi:adenosylhomocysteine nucleosidase